MLSGELAPRPLRSLVLIVGGQQRDDTGGDDNMSSSLEDEEGEGKFIGEKLKSS